MKFLRPFALALIAAIVLTGCVTVNPERDAAQTVATVNGENITKKQVYDNLGLTFEAKAEPDTAAVKSQKDDALKRLIYQKVVLQTAKAQGMYTFTADEQKKISDNVAAYTDELLQTLNMTRESVQANEEDSMAWSKLQKSVADPVTVSDSDVQTAYNALVATQATTYATNPEQLVSDDLDGTTILSYPSDSFIRVKHILIKFDDATASAISDLRKAGKIDEADAKRDEALKALESKANDALTKAKAASGNLAELDKLTTDPGEDPSMVGRKLGYPTYPGCTKYAAEFQAAAMSLTDIGVPSDLVASDFGYHIIWLTQKCAKGAVALNDIKDVYQPTVLKDKQDTAWNDAVNGYYTDYQNKGMIKEYANRLYNK